MTDPVTSALCPDLDDFLRLATEAHRDALEILLRTATAAGYDIAVGEPLWEPQENARLGKVVFAYALVRPGTPTPAGRKWWRFGSSGKKAAGLVHSGAPAA